MWHPGFGIICRTRPWIAAGLIGVASLLPVSAQVDPEELEGLNFKLGGGVSVPTNPIGRYLGVGGNVILGAGANFANRSSVGVDFLWSGLPSAVSLVRPSTLPTGNVNLFAITGNYQYSIDSVSASPFGAYLTIGGGWYDRQTSVHKNYSVPPATVCQPIYNWWGYGCDAGFVSSAVLSHGSDGGGVNAGVGFTIKVHDSGWKFFAEARYHYSWTRTYPTILVPVSIGFRFN